MVNVVVLRVHLLRGSLTKELLVLVVMVDGVVVLCIYFGNLSLLVIRVVSRSLVEHLLSDEAIRGHIVELLLGIAYWGDL